MSVASRAGKYLSKLKKDPDAYVRGEAEFAAKSVEVGGMKKAELNEMLKKGSANDKILAKGELERRAENKEVKAAIKEKVSSGKMSAAKAESSYKNRKRNPTSGEDARDSATKAKDRTYGSLDDDLDFAKGGMVKKKPAAKAKAPATKSRSHPLNKFYGK